MTLQETIKAASQGGMLVITGYRTSKQAVINYTVRLLGSQGYKDLVRESLEKVGGISRPAEIEPEVWAEALQEKTASWQKTLAGESAPRNFARAVTEHEGYSTYEDDPDTCIIRNLYKVAEEIVDGGLPFTKNSSAKTLAKEAIDKQLPIGKYLGQLNLAPGKFLSVTHQP